MQTLTEKLKKTNFAWLKTLVAPLILTLFLVVLYDLLKRYNFHDVMREIRATSAIKVCLAIGVCGLNYLVLTWYDLLAFYHIRRKLSYPKIALSSFISYTFSHNVGFALLSGGAIRYRLYSTWGLSAFEIGQIIAFSGIHFWFGLFLLGGVTCLVFPEGVLHTFKLSYLAAYAIGALLMVPIAFYLVLSATRRRVTVWKMTLDLPPLWLAVFALAVACFDWLLAAAVLYSLLPATPGLSYLDVQAAFFLAQMGAVSSHVPGGLGVFETIVVLSLSQDVPSATLLGALILYRFIYYLLPFVGGSTLLALYELRRKLKRLPATAAGESGASVVVCQLLAMLVFIGGALLLLSAATPFAPGRLALMEESAPLWLLEISHFATSLVGAGLLLTAVALSRRDVSAYRRARWLLVVGIVCSLAKAFDLNEAFYLLGALTVLFASSHHFSDRAPLPEPIGTASITAIIGVLLLAMWFAVFSYKGLTFNLSVWWNFGWRDDAARSLRGLFGACSLVLLVWLRHKKELGSDLYRNLNRERGLDQG